MTYQRLFNIRYKNKLFAIFIDQYNRKTFLEIDDNGKYIYPYIDDFIELHRIYNERNPFIVYDSKINYPISYKLPNYHNDKHSFKEFVRTITGAIALSLAINIGASLTAGVLTGRMFKLVQNDQKIEIVVDYVDGVLINNTSELDDILGYTSVSKENVIDVINSNDNIPSYYKSYAIELVEYLTNKYPETDLRIFYENMKTLKVIEKSENQMNEYTAGYYDSVNNIICIRKDHKDSRQVIIHEFAHAFHHWKEKSIVLPKYRNESIGHSLDEAMTNKITNGLVPTTTYVQEGRILDYFLSCVQYNYYDYEREGINKLITLLTEKYPDIDINYIITSIDTMKETYFSIGETIRIEENKPILDEMFNICIRNIDLNTSNIYKPFNDFIKSFDYQQYQNLVQDYLEKYNNILISNGYEKVITNSEVFITKQSYTESKKTSFREWLSDIKINEISKDNIYEPYKTYIEGMYYFSEYDSKEDAIDVCTELLDIYNNFLYCNGYKLSDTINIDSILENHQRLLDINVHGYVMTTEDKLYPIAKTIDGKIEPVDNNGNIIFVEQSKQRIYNYSPNYSAIHVLNIFRQFDKNQIELNEEYWQELFGLNLTDYKRIELYNNGELIAKEYVNCLDIFIAQKETGEISFILEKEGQQIYQSDPDDNSYVRRTYIAFDTYAYRYLKLKASHNGDITKIEMSELLNEEYLKILIAGENLDNSVNTYYSNISYDIANDSIEIHPTYYITIGEEGKKQSLNDIYLHLNPGISILALPENVISFLTSSDAQYTKLYLETVLDYYGILSKEEQNYQLTEDEIIKLYYNYIADVIYNNTNDKSR